MSESGRETGEIRDEDLPEDLQPGEDNPLAEPLDEDVDDLDVHGGKTPEEHGDGPDGESDGED
jgi:hypothetical protein